MLPKFFLPLALLKVARLSPETHQIIVLRHETSLCRSHLLAVPILDVSRLNASGENHPEDIQTQVNAISMVPIIPLIILTPFLQSYLEHLFCGASTSPPSEYATERSADKAALPPAMPYNLSALFPRPFISGLFMPLAPLEDNKELLPGTYRIIALPGTPSFPPHFLAVPTPSVDQLRALIRSHPENTQTQVILSGIPAFSIIPRPDSSLAPAMPLQLYHQAQQSVRAVPQPAAASLPPAAASATETAPLPAAATTHHGEQPHHPVSVQPQANYSEAETLLLAVRQREKSDQNAHSKTCAKLMAELNDDSLPAGLPLFPRRT